MNIAEYKAMIVIIDTREQLPLHFSPEIQVEVACLPCADYSIKGHENDVAIERKSLSDLLGSITSGRERFSKELRQLRGFRFAAIVIEATWPEILEGVYRSQVHPNAVIGSLMTFVIRYNLQIILAGDHKTAGIITERLLLNYARIVEEDFKKLERVKA